MKLPNNNCFHGVCYRRVPMHTSRWKYYLLKALRIYLTYRWKRALLLGTTNETKCSMYNIKMTSLCIIIFTRQLLTFNLISTMTSPVHELWLPNDRKPPYTSASLPSKLTSYLHMLWPSSNWLSPSSSSSSHSLSFWSKPSRKEIWESISNTFSL